MKKGIIPRDIEKLAERFHQVYELELERQGKKSKHAKEYKDLPEDIKDLDRALAKYVMFLIDNLGMEEG